MWLPPRRRPRGRVEESRFWAATRPTARIAFGRTSSICRRNHAAQLATSSGRGSRLFGGRHFTMLAMVDLFSGDSEREEHGIEESARTPHEGLAPRVLLCAGTLSDDHEGCGARPHPEHRVSPSPMKGATRADFDHAAKRFMVCVFGIGGGFGVEALAHRHGRHGFRAGRRQCLTWDPERDPHRVQIAPATPFPPVRPWRDGATRRVHPWRWCRCVEPPAGGGVRPG